MAITTQYLTGFEHGFVGTAATTGLGLFDTVTAGCSASTTTPRNGSYCLKVTAPANTPTHVRRAIAASKIVTRFAVKVFAFPATAPQPFTLLHFVGASGTGISLQLLDTGQLNAVYSPISQQSAAISLNTWYMVEFQIDSLAGTIDWKVDGVAQTPVTGGTNFLQAQTHIGLGTHSTNRPAFTADFDDWIVGTWTVAGTDWWGDGKVLAQLAGVDGTHATVTSLSPGDAGVAYAGTPTNVNTMVDDAAGTGGWTATRSTTDNVALRTATVGAYASIGPATTAEAGVANAVRAILSYSSSSATANLAACDVRNSAAAITELWGLTGGVGKDFSESTNFFKGAIVTVPAGGWTASEVNAVRWRFGGCTSVDVSPIPTCQALMLEVDWPVAAAADVIPNVVMAA